MTTTTLIIATIAIVLVLIVLPLSVWVLCELGLAMPEKPEWRNRCCNSSPRQKNEYRMPSRTSCRSVAKNATMPKHDTTDKWRQ